MAAQLSSPDLDAYEKELASSPFGLNNLGNYCHFNALLQSLASCTAIVRAAIKNKDYLESTRTGKAFRNFVQAFADEKGAKKNPDIGIEGQSLRVLQALTADLGERRPGHRFGKEVNAQRDTHEGLAMLLEMIEPPGKEQKEHGGTQSTIHHLSKLFQNVYKYTFTCKTCKASTVVCERDVCLQIMWAAGDTHEKFAESILRGIESSVEGFFCKMCKAKRTHTKYYHLRRAAEVIACYFNVFDDPALTRGPDWHIPQAFLLPGIGRRKFLYRKVAEAEHSGTAQSGHYFARGLRAGGKVVALDDSRTYASSFEEGSKNKYLVLYHYCGAVNPQTEKENSQPNAPSSAPPVSSAKPDVFDLSELYESI